MSQVAIQHDASMYAQLFSFNFRFWICDEIYLDIVWRKQSDHRIVFALVPVLVDLSSDKYDVAATESQFPRRLTDEVVERPCDQTRFRCLILGPTPLAEIVHKVVVAIQRYGRLLRGSEIAEERTVGVEIKLFLEPRELSFPFAPSKCHLISRWLSSICESTDISRRNVDLFFSVFFSFNIPFLHPLSKLINARCFISYLINNYGIICFLSK